MTKNICPECKQGKHVNCVEVAWDDEIDAPVPCECMTNFHAEEA